MINQEQKLNLIKHLKIVNVVEHGLFGMKIAMLQEPCPIMMVKKMVTMHSIFKMDLKRKKALGKMINEMVCGFKT